MINCKSIVSLAVTTLLSTVTSFTYQKSTIATPRRISTTFYCVQNNSSGGWATVARRGENVTPPIITWNTYYFGSEYTPEKRCNFVSNKLTSVVAANGGSLQDLLLTIGPVNGLTVVCYVNEGQEACNSYNMLFTLKPENARRAGEVLAQILNFSVTGTGSPVQEQNGRPYVRLDQLNQILGPETIDAQPNPSPRVQPNPPQRQPVSPSPSTGGGI
ncbi:COP23 domain-containing protein [Limnoraphis robusta]|uniref:COP23 domain-containing protein n=1 Tax=Limnoraphis robusta CCNP1315 TaxID=3110306 RepID=A0ABU5TR23_9CYAN|nr:COP23 domain-containing protein [Limnoraphis robusta]MEA5497548.1 COP23 domain-containing protein [Limnoraphis robusta BA-68 BA1]MEA5517331.1 COP23 domain-containing protein [Limnoraphis robusta CCNP1315]MEA5546080.1 COP23 domain-containing protein [Limnoraphis robusta CCNP1324]